MPSWTRLFSKCLPIVFVVMTASGCAPLWYTDDGGISSPTRNTQLASKPSRRPRRIVPGSAEERTIAQDIEAHEEFPDTPSLFPAVRIEKSIEVDRFVQHYVTENRMFLEESLERRQTYLPTMEAIFQKYGLPKELINIALIESGFQPGVRSDQGAAGMWQFMSRTAKTYGLRVNPAVDDRRDVLKSTIAAARHLSDLYDNFEDWYLAIAAYNMGAGGVSRAIEQGGTRNFFELARKGFLNKETSEFVPRFLAVTKICQNTTAYGLVSDRDISLYAKDSTKRRRNFTDEF